MVTWSVWWCCGCCWWNLPCWCGCWGGPLSTRNMHVSIARQVQVPHAHTCHTRNIRCFKRMIICLATCIPHKKDYMPQHAMFGATHHFFGFCSKTWCSHHICNSSGRIFAMLGRGCCVNVCWSLARFQRRLLVRLAMSEWLFQTICSSA